VRYWPRGFMYPSVDRLMGSRMLCQAPVGCREQYHLDAQPNGISKVAIRRRADKP